MPWQSIFRTNYSRRTQCCDASFAKLDIAVLRATHVHRTKCRLDSSRQSYAQEKMGIGYRDRGCTVRDCLYCKLALKNRVNSTRTDERATITLSPFLNTARMYNLETGRGGFHRRRDNWEQGRLNTQVTRWSPVSFPWNFQHMCV